MEFVNGRKGDEGDREQRDMAPNKVNYRRNDEKETNSNAITKSCHDYCYVLFCFSRVSVKVMVR